MTQQKAADWRIKSSEWQDEILLLAAREGKQNEKHKKNRQPQRILAVCFFIGLYGWSKIFVKSIIFRTSLYYPITGLPFSVALDDSVIFTMQRSPVRKVCCVPSARVTVRSNTTILFCDVLPHICSRERLL